MEAANESLPFPIEMSLNFTLSSVQTFIGTQTEPNSPEPQIIISWSFVKAAEKLPAFTLLIMQRSRVYILIGDRLFCNWGYQLMSPSSKRLLVPLPYTYPLSVNIRVCLYPQDTSATLSNIPVTRVGLSLNVLQSTPKASYPSELSPKVYKSPEAVIRAVC